jgi:hypothetical protein
MCDFSLEAYKSRAARDDEELVVKKFSSNSKGLVSAKDEDCAVCCKNGVEMTCNFPEGTYSMALVGKRFDVVAEVLSGEIDVYFHTVAAYTPHGFMSMYRDGFLTKDCRFISLQELPEGTRVTITKALPAALKSAATGFVAFKEEDEVGQIEAPVFEHIHVD